MPDLIEFLGWENFWAWAAPECVEKLSQRESETLWKQDNSLGIIFSDKGRIGYVNIFKTEHNRYFCAYATLGLHQQLDQLQDCTSSDILDLIIS